MVGHSNAITTKYEAELDFNDKKYLCHHRPQPPSAEIAKNQDPKSGWPLLKSPKSQIPLGSRTHGGSARGRTRFEDRKSASCEKTDGPRV